ncbi:MAG: DUF433 domain-containing protein [Candidatus Methylomirabilis oxyfera]|nr:DUF433 domain-containing protein [Candidatus Methylomirabilis oxyfera]
MERIVVNPKVHFGKPCVAGTRITVQSVLELLNEGMSFDEIIQNYYPELTTDDIRACIEYAIALVAAEDIHLRSVPV